MILELLHYKKLGKKIAYDQLLVCEPVLPPKITVYAAIMLCQKKVIAHGR